MVSDQYEPAIDGLLWSLTVGWGVEGLMKKRSWLELRPRSSY